MRLDRKFFLIAPSLVLVLVCAGLFYTATRLQLLAGGSADLARRSAYVTSVERGERTLTASHAIEIVRFSLDAEGRRTSAIVAAHDLIVMLAWIGVACCVVLLWTIRRVPREPRTKGTQARPALSATWTPNS